MNESVLNNQSADIELTKLNPNETFESNNDSETDESRKETKSSKNSMSNNIELISKVI